jgi:hypothetical protein
MKQITVDDIDNVIASLPEDDHTKYLLDKLKSEQPHIYEFLYYDMGLKKDELDLLLEITLIAWFVIRNTLNRKGKISADYLFEQYDRNYLNYHEQIYKKDKDDSEIHDSLSYPNNQPQLMSYITLLISAKLDAPGCRLRESVIPEIVVNAKTVIDCLVIDEKKALAETCDKHYSEKNFKSVKKEAAAYADEFKKSAFYMKLKHKEKYEAELIITAFSEMMYLYFLMKPVNWNARRTVECLTGIMPAKVAADDAYFEAIEPVMTAFMKFCGSRKYVTDADIISRRLAGITERIMEEAAKKDSWSTGKSLFKEAESKGIDITDKKQFDAFIKEYNKNKKNIFQPSPVNETAVPEPGRNDSCPCGSGRKYKKCCGADK